VGELKGRGRKDLPLGAEAVLYMVVVGESMNSTNRLQRRET